MSRIEAIHRHGLFGPPELMRIPHDGRINYVGRLDDGTQFMAFVSGAIPDGYCFPREGDDWRKVKRWIAVLHLFDANGSRLHSDAKLGGFDIEGWHEVGQRALGELDKLLATLRARKPQLCDIHIRLFSIVLDGVTHGLMYRQEQPEEDGPVFEGVFLEPRDIMFHPPWDSGEYST